MQVNYRTIGSYEYDAISGQYKQVDKQVEDYSSTSNSDFTDILGKLGGDDFGSSNSEQTLQNNTQSSNFNQMPSQYAQMSSVYAYRFRQNEGELSLKAQSASVHNDLLNQNANGQNKENNLLNDLLSAI